MLSEFLGTFFLVFTIVGVAVNPRAATDWAALTIGGALGVGALALAPLSGAGFNPARAFGPSLAADAFGGMGSFLLAYVLAPILGALAAAYLYTTLLASPDDKEAGGMEPVG